MSERLLKMYSFMMVTERNGTVNEPEMAGLAKWNAIPFFSEWLIRMFLHR